MIPFNSGRKTTAGPEGFPQHFRDARIFLTQVNPPCPLSIKDSRGIDSYVSAKTLFVQVIYFGIVSSHASLTMSFNSYKEITMNFFLRSANLHIQHSYE